MTYEEYKMAVEDAACILYRAVCAASLDNLRFDVGIDDGMDIHNEVSYSGRVGEARIISGFGVPDAETRLRHYEVIHDAAKRLAAVLEQAAKDHFAFDVEEFGYDAGYPLAIVRPRTSYVRM